MEYFGGMCAGVLSFLFKFTRCFGKWPLPGIGVVVDRGARWMGVWRHVCRECMPVMN